MPENISPRADGKSLAAVLVEIKNELLSFVETRIRMAHAELEQSKQAIKGALPLLLVAGGFVATAFLLFTALLVTLISFAFGNNIYRWPLALLIVAVLWAITGALMAVLAKNALKGHGTFPHKTVEVLKADGLWLRDEVKSA